MPTSNGGQRRSAELASSASAKIELLACWATWKDRKCWRVLKIEVGR
jgi:hypothetical protein